MVDRRVVIISEQRRTHRFGPKICYFPAGPDAVDPSTMERKHAFPALRSATAKCLKHRHGIA
jgi:hypothetical protein